MLYTYAQIPVSIYMTPPHRKSSANHYIMIFNRFSIRVCTLLLYNTVLYYYDIILNHNNKVLINMHYLD